MAHASGKTGFRRVAENSTRVASLPRKEQNGNPPQDMRWPVFYSTLLRTGLIPLFAEWGDDFAHINADTFQPGGVSVFGDD